ncbi:MAG: TatD family hydrolase [Herpetosiphon sp.]
MPLIDTHVHLFASGFDADRAAVLGRATDAGVARMLCVGYDLPTSRAAIAMTAEPMIWATAGIQPHYAEQTGDREINELGRLLSQPRVVALGEIGLDYHHDRAPRPLQADLFRRQLDLARERKLPVVIHSREAHADTLTILQSHGRGLTIVMHSFSGPWAVAEPLLELGAYLSFSGPVTFPKATDLHDVARRVPLERLLIETDCPYLAPQGHRGKRNEPAFVRIVAEQIARLREITLDDVAAAIWRNSALIWRFDGDDHAIAADLSQSRN